MTGTAHGARRTAPGTTLAPTQHTSRPWRIHEVTHDFRLEDVWGLPVVGGPDDFPDLVRLVASFDPAKLSSFAARVLVVVRTRLGALLGWDRRETGLGARVATLRHRLPPDLRRVPAGPAPDSLGFVPLYLLEDEWAAEIANTTMHGVLHLGWVPDEVGGYRGQMAVLVKPNGLRGRAYMAAIRPFRHLIVYPALLRALECEWKARVNEAN